MKNKLLIYILLSFFCMVPAKAQVLEYYVQADDHAIVREFDTAEALAYVEDVSGQGYFMFYSYGSSFALKFQCLNGWSVKDVRIRDGKAYFCGTVAGHVALVGCFDVLAVFAGTDSVNYALMDWMSPDSLVLATSLNRLDLMPVGPRAVMAMVGDAWYQQYAYKTTAVVSAYFTGSQWFIYQFVNKDAYVRYTDIAYLDNMIVAVGPDSTGKNCLMKSFHPYIDFPNNPFVFRAVSRLSYTSLVGKVLAGYVGANTMEVAQHVFPKSPETILHHIVFDPITGLPSNPILYQHTATSSMLDYWTYGWELYDLVFSRLGIHVLEQAEHPTAITGMQRWLLSFQTNYSSSFADAWHMILGDFHTMDNGLYGRVQVSGTSSSNQYETYLDVCTHAPYTCGPRYLLPVKYGTTSWTTVEIDEGCVDDRYNNSVLHPSLTPVPRGEKCD